MIQSNRQSSFHKRLALCLFVLGATLPLHVWAVDTDGDGVDDSIDAFPSYPEATTDTDGDGKPDTIDTGRLMVFSDSFESGNLTAGGWVKGGTANPWFAATSASAYHGGFIAQVNSGGALYSYYSSISKTVNLPSAGTVSFYMKYSYNADNSMAFRFFRNGVLAAEWKQDVTSWTSYSYALPAGSTTMKWELQSGFPGDTVRIDAVEVSRPTLLIVDDDDDNDGVPDYLDPESHNPT